MDARALYRVIQCPWRLCLRGIKASLKLSVVFANPSVGGRVYLRGCMCLYLCVSLSLCVSPCVSVCPWVWLCKRSLRLRIIALRRCYGNGLGWPVWLLPQLEMCGYDAFCYLYKRFVGYWNASYVFNPFQTAAFRRVQRHTGLTHHFEFLTSGHSGAQSWAPERPNVKS